VLDQNKNINAD